MQSHSQYPQKRMRRLRRNAFSRRLVQETNLQAQDLILPCFCIRGAESKRRCGINARYSTSEY